MIPYRVISKLTPLEIVRCVEEANKLKWSVSHMEAYSHRTMAYIRVAPNLDGRVPTPEDVFTYSTGSVKCPHLISVMRRVGLAMGCRLDDYGTAYISRMVAGDYVAEHFHAAKLEPYYDQQQRVQVVIKDTLTTEFKFDGQVVAGTVGECVLFDATMKHSVYCSGDPAGERLCLLFDVRK